MTTATLGFVIDSSQAESAAADLDKLVASATKTETSVEKLGRSSKKALTDAGAGSSEFSRKIQSAIQQTENLGRTFGAQDDHVRAFRDEIDRLTNKFQPLVAEEKRHAAAIRDIESAHRFGITSAQQMTRALEQERLAYERVKTSAATAGAAVKAANANVPRGGAAAGGINPATNSMFQFQDIAMTAAMGMNPGMIGLQQGSQLAGAYAGMSMKQAAASAGAGLIGMLNPLSLVTIGLTTATAAAIQYFMTSSDGTDQMAVDLDRQHELIGKVAARWGDLAPALKSYADEVERARMAQEDQQAATEGASLKIKSLRRDYDELITIMGRMDRDYSLSNAVNSADTEKVAAFRAGMIGVNEAIAAGKDPTDSLNGALASLTSILGDKANPVIKEFHALLSGAAARMRETAGVARDIRESFQGLKPLSAPWSEDGRFLYEESFIPRNPAVPTPRPNIELSGDPNDTAIPTQLSRLLSGATDSANAYSTALKGVETANAGVIDVTGSLAMAQVQQLSAMEQTSAHLRSMQKELNEVNAAIKTAANLPLSEIFGDFAGREEADALASARTSLEKTMEALKSGGSSAAMAHDAIEGVRRSLKALGGDAAFVDRLVDSLVAGYTRAMQLDGGIKQLSQSIMGIPNRVISIGVQRYDVPSSGGGTTGINVYGAGADMSGQQYDVGGKTIGVYSGNGPAVRTQGYLVDQSDVQTMLELQGKRAAGGPVSGGGLYLVGEQGPELLKMSGAGNVTNAGSTASILSGGRDTLSLIEDNTYDLVQEMRIHTDYFETFESDFVEMIACLKAIKSVGSSSYSGGGSSYSSGSSYSGGSSSDGGQSHLDPYSPYYFNAARNNAGRGGGRYDPIADALMNGNTEALRNLSGGPTAAISRALAGHNMPSLLDRLKKQAGFATGGQIMPGEDQKVEFFKRRKERVIIVDDANVSDQRGASQQAAPQALPPIQITNYFQGDVGDARSRQSMEDQFRRAVQQAIRR